MRVFHAAVEEGWDEFANAVLAFFLFSQPAYFEGKLHVDWHDLAAALRLSSSFRGHHRVKVALAIADQLVCGSDQQGIDALNLAGWVPADISASESLSSATPKKVQPNIEDELVELLGKEAWLKLSNDAKQRLREAEFQLSRLCHKLGAGLDDWGGPALSYVKAIEFELQQRLENVFVSDAYNDYLKKENKKKEVRQ